MNPRDYNIQLAEIRLRRDEEAGEKRRKFIRRVVNPAWYTGLASAYIYSLTSYIFIPEARLLALGCFILSFIVFFEIWKYPREKSISALLSRFQCERRIIKGIVLLVSIPLANLVNLVLLYSLSRIPW